MFLFPNSLSRRCSFVRSIRRRSRFDAGLALHLKGALPVAPIGGEGALFLFLGFALPGVLVSLFYTLS